jgi:methylenetetrahydrofolate--tRNA-(uracil-5-)-methyltransferase
MPIEEMAERGDETLRFGPMKPVGLPDPATGRDPWAVVQLRAENNEKTLYNLVGFQTKMTWPEQRRVLGPWRQNCKTGPKRKAGSLE